MLRNWQKEASKQQDYRTKQYLLELIKQDIEKTEKKIKMAFYKRP